MSDELEREGVSARHRQMADEEAARWETTPPDQRKKGGIGESLSPVVGRPAGSIRLRHELWRAGPAANDLWDALDKGMPLYTAARLLRTARAKIGRDLSILPDAVAEEVTLYRLRSRDPGQARIPVPTEPIPEPPPSEPSPAPGDSDPWDAVSSLVRDAARPIVAGLSPEIGQRVLAEFDAELRRSVAWLRGRVRAAARSLPDAALIPARKDVTSWCSVLHMDPPRPGRPVDESVLRRQYRALSVRYHPDLNPNAPGRDQAQRDLNDAYRGLTDYNASLKETEQ